MNIDIAEVVRRGEDAVIEIVARHTHHERLRVLEMLGEYVHNASDAEIDMIGRATNRAFIARDVASYARHAKAIRIGASLVHQERLSQREFQRVVDGDRMAVGFVAARPYPIQPLPGEPDPETLPLKPEVQVHIDRLNAYVAELLAQAALGQPVPPDMEPEELPKPVKDGGE